jgi:hypothetical protein
MTAKTLTLMAAAALLAAASTSGPAQARDEKTTHGHEMQEKGSVKGHPGASGYSPGHEMQKKEAGQVSLAPPDMRRVTNSLAALSSASRI